MAQAADVSRRLAAFERQLSYSRLALYRPYPKQREFHALGTERRERCLFGANGGRHARHRPVPAVVGGPALR